MATYEPNLRGQCIKNIVGLISIKDIFEDIMQEELIDEDGHFDSESPNIQNNFIKNTLSKQTIELKVRGNKEPLL